MNTELQILQAIADYLGLSIEDIDRHASLRDELNLGPIELNDLLAHLAAKFDVTFDETEIEDIKKIDDLIVLVEDNLLE